MFTVLEVAILHRELPLEQKFLQLWLIRAYFQVMCFLLGGPSMCPPQGAHHLWAHALESFTGGESK